MLPAAGIWRGRTGNRCPTCPLLLEGLWCPLSHLDLFHQVLIGSHFVWGCWWEHKVAITKWSNWAHWCKYIINYCLYQNRVIMKHCTAVKMKIVPQNSYFPLIFSHTYKWLSFLRTLPDALWCISHPEHRPSSRPACPVTSKGTTSR